MNKHWKIAQDKAKAEKQKQEEVNRLLAEIIDGLRPRRAVKIDAKITSSSAEAPTVRNRRILGYEHETRSQRMAHD